MIELDTIAPKKFEQNFAGAVPTLDSTDDVFVGDFAIDTSNDDVWQCHDNTDTAPVWVRQLRQIAQYTNTNTTTNLNTVGFTEIPITGTQEFLDPGYTLSGNGVQVDFTGRIKVTASINLDSAGTPNRTGLEMAVFIAGVEQNGRSNAAYLRNAAHQFDGLSLSKVYSITSGQVVTIRSIRVSTNTVGINMVTSGTSFMTIERV